LKDGWIMKRTAVVMLAAIGLGGCVYGPGGYGDGGYGAVGYGAGGYGPGPVGVVAYNAYYDGAVGPYYDGYWNGGAFYYRRDRDHPYVRDMNNHFRRDPRPGYHQVRAVRSNPNRGNPGGGNPHARPDQR
jgi:hypothetical protein